jgi:hypothetical protein
MGDQHIYTSFKEKIRAAGTPVFGRVAFEYIDVNGRATQRLVDLIATFYDGVGHYFLGHCYLRGELRTFHSAQSHHVWDASAFRWYRDLRDWARDAPLRGRARAMPTELERKLLCFGRRPSSEEVVGMMDSAATRDIEELATRFTVVGAWRVDLYGTAGNGTLTLRLYPLSPPDSKRQISVCYAPAIEIERRLASASSPQWAVDRMPWRLVPSWPRPTKGYSTINAVIESLLTRRILA